MNKFIDFVISNNNLFNIHSDICIKYQLCNSFVPDETLYSEWDKKIHNIFKGCDVFSYKQIENDVRHFFENEFKEYINTFTKDNMYLLFDDNVTDICNNTIYNLNQFLKSIKYNKDDLVNYILNK